MRICKFSPIVSWSYCFDLYMFVFLFVRLGPILLLAWSYPALSKSTGVMHSAEATRISWLKLESLPARCLYKCLFDGLLLLNNAHLLICNYEFNWCFNFNKHMLVTNLSEMLPCH